MPYNPIPQEILDALSKLDDLRGAQYDSKLRGQAETLVRGLPALTAKHFGELSSTFDSFPKDGFQGKVKELDALLEVYTAALGAIAHAYASIERYRERAGS